MILGPNFRLIDQHLVLVWADLHLFGMFLQHFLGVIISDQTCNAPNAPKISSIMIRISMKLNWASYWQYYDILDIYHLRVGHRAPHTPEIEIFKVPLELASSIQIHSLI